MIEYPIGTSGQVLVFESEVLEHFRRQRQRRWFDREAGGQLFARIDGARVIVVEATGPRPSDRRSPFSYAPSRRDERAEILDRYAKGLHFVGDWHTHPERLPRPSHPDCTSIGECVRRSKHSLNGFVIAVVGQAEPPDGLFVAIHDGMRAHRLLPESIDDRRAGRPSRRA
jgi:integrative and conjugative element protein (TIGR02256 family)